jgi:hypothetical protein
LADYVSACKGLKPKLFTISWNCEVVEIGFATEVEIGRKMEAQTRIEHNATKQRPTNYYSRLTSKPQRPAVSQRSALGKRLRDLADAFAERLGGWPALSVTTAAAVRKAAELVAISEQMRRDALRNGCTDPDALLRFEGCASRAVRQLGLKVESAPARARGLEIARRRWSETEARAAKAKDAKEASATPTTEPPDGRA